MAEISFNDTTEDTIENAESLEKHVKTVAMRAESLAATEADLFKTLLDRKEVAQKHMNELSAQLSTIAPAVSVSHIDESREIMIFVKFSSSLSFLILVLTMLGEPSWEALWPYLNVPESLQMRVSAQPFNDATKYGPYCELFLFLMKSQPEPHVSTDSFLHVPWSLPLRMTRAGERSQCLLGTSSDPCRSGRLCMFHTRGFGSTFLSDCPCDALDPTVLCPEGVTSSHFATPRTCHTHATPVHARNSARLHTLHN